MDIKKLGLISTVAMLSVTVSLGGCDLFKSETPEKQEAKIKAVWDKVNDEFWTTDAKANRAKGKLSLYHIDSSEYKKAYAEYQKAYAEYQKAYAELRNLPKPKSDKAEAKKIEEEKRLKAVEKAAYWKKYYEDVNAILHRRPIDTRSPWEWYRAHK